MPNEPEDNDIGDRIAHMTMVALMAAMESKGARLTDDEEEAILDNCTFSVLALANGLSPAAVAAMWKAEARGTQVWH